MKPLHLDSPPVLIKSSKKEEEAGDQTYNYPTITKKSLLKSVKSSFKTISSLQCPLLVQKWNFLILRSGKKSRTIKVNHEKSLTVEVNQEKFLTVKTN